MPWIRFEDNFAEHPKVLAVSDAAFRLHIRAVAYCSRLLTDGAVSVAALASIKSGKWGLRLADELVDARLWEKRHDGYQIHDYLHYQPSRAHIEEIRKQRADAGRRGGKANGKQIA